jgi:hypothetical protein
MSIAIGEEKEMSKDLKRAAKNFIDYLEKKSEADRDLVQPILIGFSKYLPYGFTDYLRRVILSSLKDLRTEKERALLETWIVSMEDDKASEITDESKILFKEFYQIISPLLRSYKQLLECSKAKPILRQEIVQARMDEIFRESFRACIDEISPSWDLLYKKLLNPYWNRRTLRLYEFNAVVICQQEIVEEAVRHYDQFSQELGKAAKYFYKDKTEKSFRESVAYIIKAYDRFFQAIHDKMAVWIRTKFGYLGEQVSDFESFSDIVLPLAQLLSEALSRVERSFSEEKLFLLDHLKEAVVLIRSEVNDLKLNDSLFKTFYGSFFSMTMEVDRVCHDNRVSKSGRIVREYLGGMMYVEEGSAPKHLDLLRYFNAIKRAIDTLNRSNPQWYRFFLWIFKLFPSLKRASDEIMSQRRSCADQCQSIYTQVLENETVKPEDKKRTLVLELRNTLFSDQSPYRKHRLTKNAKKQTRSEKYLDEMLTIPEV